MFRHVQRCVIVIYILKRTPSFFEIRDMSRPGWLFLEKIDFQKWIIIVKSKFAIIDSELSVFL